VLWEYNLTRIQSALNNRSLSVFPEQIADARTRAIFLDASYFRTVCYGYSTAFPHFERLSNLRDFSLGLPRIHTGDELGSRLKSKLQDD
jgi:hypothetical protein